MRGRLKFELTQRPLLKIITSIKQKIIERIGENIGPQYQQDIAAALEDREINERIMNLVEN